MLISGLNLLVLLLSFLGHSGLIAAFLNWRFEAAFLLSVSGYILVLFAAALAGILYQADMALLYSGLPALFVTCWLLLRRRSELRQVLFQPPLILFLVS